MIVRQFLQCFKTVNELDVFLDVRNAFLPFFTFGAGAGGLGGWGWGLVPADRFPLLASRLREPGLMQRRRIGPKLSKLH